MDEPKSGEKKDSAQASVAGLLVSTELDMFDSPSLVVNGLQLKSAKNQKLLECFSYVLSPFTKGPVSLEKLIWHQAYPIRSEHIRCHVLNSDDDIPKLIAQYHHESAQAVILINSANNYTLASPSLHGDAQMDIPVIVITSLDGEILLSIINDCPPGEVLAQIVPKDSGFLLPQSPSIRRRRITKKGSSKSELIRGSSKGPVDPWKQFQLYAFSLGRPVSICSERDIFWFLMYAFNQYEFEGKSQCEGLGKQSENLLKKLLKHLDEHKMNPAVFDENFPFYVLLAIRMYRNQDVYQCGELDKFIETVTEKVESLPAKKIAEVVDGFLQQDDFEIMDGHGLTANVSTFQQLYTACEQILVLRFDKKHKRYLYCRILWITIAIRCCQFDNTLMFDEMPRTAEKLWNDYILQDKSSIVLSSEVITDIQKGLTLGGYLLLPDELQFNASRMSFLLFPRGQMRPLQHIRNFIFHVMEFLHSEERFVSSFMKASRDHYGHLLFPDNTATLSSKYVDASVTHTVHGLVEEGVRFLNVVFVVAMQRRWNSNDLRTQCKRWFSLLVQSIKIKRGAESTLRILLESGRDDTITKNKEYRPHIETEIIKKTRGMFGKLNISVFYPLYKEFYIWSNEFLSDYLKTYPSSQVELTDENWTLLFKEVVNRYPESSSHDFILDFLLSEAVFYAGAGKAGTFILDLMKLDVPKLFASPPHSTSENFKENLHSYIFANSLSRELQKSVESIMDHIHDDPHSFQDLILTVLQKDITPQLYSSAVQKTALRLLNTVINVLSKNVCRRDNLTRKERFCWGIIVTFCEQIKPRQDSFKWVESFTAVIEKMGEIYGFYCQKRNIKHASVQMRPDIYRCPPDVVKYYEWVQQIHKFFSDWHTKFLLEEINHDDMVDYDVSHGSLCKVAKAVCATGMIIEDQHISELRTNYLKDFEQLNLLLLRYVHEVPRVKWRILTSVLNMYGIGLPKALQEKLEQFIVLPGENVNPTKLTLQRHHLAPSTTGKFQPPQPISLVLSEGFTLKIMKTFIRELESFLTPIQENMEMLIFFSLHDSQLFSAYVKQELKMDTDVNAFGKALVQAKNILLQVCHGEAYYSQITANGTVCLETLDIQEEFIILLKSKQLDKLPGLKTTRGLGDVKNLVDLMKISAHIRVVRHLCQQYQLEGCLKDENLIKLTALAEELMTEEAKVSLTPSIATDKMETVRELLGAKGGVGTHDYEYLAIFSKIADSAEFYQFICEKGFTGENGQARFHQQYQLITAQLQHEEYDEAVLNVLYAAYKLILPFTVKTQSFHSLLESVEHLLTVSSPVGSAKTIHDYLVQIETVNRNINLIQLWFSRAEGDTMQNVASDLDRVFQTGHYNFIIPENMAEPGKVELMYKPSTKRTLVVNAEIPSEEETSRIRQKGDSVKAEIWDSEQTSTFVRKLGFLDSEKAGGNMVKSFLHINEVANKLLEFLLKLREMGYPSHLTDVAKNGLKCNVHGDEVDRMVDEMEHIMKVWSQDIDKLLLRHNWLLLFSIPKLLRLSKLLRSDIQLDSLTMKIMEETSFLFSRQVKDSGGVMLAIKDSLKALRKEVLNLEQAKDASVPLRICGIFMDEMFKHSDMKYSYKDQLLYPACSRRSLLYSTHNVEVLHSALNFSQGELIPVIVNIYDGRLPQPYEFFRCHGNTTTHELKLFLTRAINHPLTFMILGVNLLPVKLQEVVLRQHVEFHSSSDHKIKPCIHYMETLPSILHEMPWIQQEKHNLSDLVKLKDVQETCHQQAIVERGLKCVQLVYGVAGVGKTHYIREQLANCRSVTIAVNEGFEPIKAIQRLHILPKDENNCAIFFNFNLIPPFGDSVHKKDKKNYDTLMESISWFFFDLLFLGYVEDSHSGESFHLPGGLSWSIYVEVPARSLSSCVDEFLEEFRSEIPIFKLLGTTKLIQSDVQYCVDSEKDSGVQLVCKYLKAYETGGKKGIDKLYKEGHKQSKPVKFSAEPDLPSDVCERLLAKYIPPSIRNTKTLQQLFLRYMERRCRFLDNLPAYNYNTGAGIMVGTGEVTDTRHLGSTLMATMIREADQFCHPCIEEDRNYHQLIYDVQDGGGSIGLISTAPHKLTELKKIGVEIPTMVELHQREYLDKCLSRALNIPLNDNKRLTAIDDENYVLTLDFAIKMLQINERHECGEPVIIQGETGVGKTALIQMLSKLWNASLDMEQKRLRERLLEFLQNKLKNGSSFVPDQYKAWLQAVNSMISGVKKSVEEEDLMLIAMLPCKESHLYLEMKNYLKKIAGNPLLPLLEITCQQHKPLDVLFKEAVADPSDLADCSPENEAKPVVKVFHALLTAVIKSTFHKLSVHAALKPADLSKVLGTVFEQAQQLKKATEGACASFSRAPNVTVFLDELNASTCGGLFKELIIDKSFEGEPIPENVFIIAACNPHRGNSLAALNLATKTSKPRANNTLDETWIMDSYYVRQLHPTLAHLMWDYGSLGEDQERQYVQAKVDMQSSWLSDLQKTTLTEVIVSSQKLIRQYAFEELNKWKLTEQEARFSSKCCVSQRDIQRTFTFYGWLLKFYRRMKPYNDDDFTSSYRAILVALGVVYYMRLNTKYRAKYEQDLTLKHKFTALPFSEAFQSELEWYAQQIEFPKGIAKTQALKENLLAIILCTVTQTPLIIVGAPGSSKTLSFNIAVSNLKGQESKKYVFRNTDIFLSLDPHFYQCSRCTTSNEIQTVFSRAIARQKNNALFSLPIKCIVFMDEAGLPEHSHESLKILHSYLDNPSVSFVAISNTVLDAAKTNRAVTLFRDPLEITKDLKVLATECLFESPGCPPLNLREHINVIVDLHNAYTHIMTEMKLNNFFGLRDFIHFLHYIRRMCVQRGTDLSLHQVGQIVTESLERNFSGSQQLLEILEVFLDRMNVPTADVARCDPVLVLKDSLNEMPGMEDEVRYKIVIHSSEDDSLVRLLFQLKILERRNARIYICSDFPGDIELQKIDTIAGIRHSAIQGHSIVMLQTDDIHESFYDLFNRRFQRIDDPKFGTRLYANIAIGAHLKPCRVHPKFQCVVAIKKSELDRTPAPFLNRFEKYYITHKSVLESVLGSFPAEFKSVMEAAYEKVQQFVQCIGGASAFYGLCEETVDSLLLTVLPLESKLPTTDMNTVSLQQLPSTDNFENAHRKQICILQVLTEALKLNFNFCYQECSEEEMKWDAEHLFQLVLSSNPDFKGVMRMEMKDPVSARVAVLSALDTLQRGHVDSTYAAYAAAPATKLIWSLLVQWLVRHFCKALMQLMTPEALVLHERQVPASYIHNYLTYQKHFSLKDLIQQQLLKIGKSPSTKLLCFTRTSPLIHKLPSVYPSAFHSPTEIADYESDLKTIVLQDVSALVVCKLEGAQSQRSIKESLKTFMESDKMVMFLLANMQEVSRNTVNHLRVMIEEEEAIAKESSRPKLFLLLLHFPPSMFFTACYPSLFLEGWDHYYLDTIAHGLSIGIVDSVKWFYMSCIPSEQSTSSAEDPFFKMLKHLLHQSIPHVVSRLSFGSDYSTTRPFNQKMTPLARSEGLQRLFDTEVGDALCHHFQSYWKAEVMTEYLHRAVKFTQAGKTTLNITDSIHSIMKSHFLDFVVYMVDYMNDNYNLDIFFSRKSTEEVKQLFLDLTRCLPIPQKLSKLKILSSVQQVSKCKEKVTGGYLFPFFAIVSPQIMDIVKEAACNLCQSEDLRNTDGTSLQERREFDFEEQLQKQVEKHLVNIMKDHEGCVAVAVAAMNKHRELWDRYFHDFTREQLSLWSHNQQVIEETLEAAFGTVCTSSASTVSQLTSLHVYTHLNQSTISKNVAALMSLIKLTSVSEQVSGRIRSSSTSSAILLTTEDTNTFVLNTLFNTLLTVFGKRHSLITDMKLWYNAYHAMTLSPAVRKRIYSSLSATSEAKLNVMHAAFLAVQYDPSDNDLLMRCQAMVNGLRSEHFVMRGLELNGRGPQIAEISVAVAEAFGRHRAVDSPDVEPAVEAFITEGLLTHFFCYYEKPHKNNVWWLLGHINEQKHWLRSSSLSRISLASQSSCDSDQVQSDLLFHYNSHRVPLNLFKYYLLKILGTQTNAREERRKQWVPPFETEGRAIVGRFLSKQISSDVTGTYVPPFYQLPGVAISENGLESQPLAYLYFMTVLEYLFNQHSDLSDLLNITLEMYETGPDEMIEKILCCIEKQALVQVIIREFAKHLVPDNYIFVASKLAKLQKHLNALICEQTSGGRVQVHGDILAMHLLKEAQSLETFTRLFTELYDTHCTDYKCLQTFQGVITEPYNSRANFFDLLHQEDKNSQLGKLYMQVQRTVMATVEGKGELNKLIKLAKESQKSQMSLQASAETPEFMEKVSCLRMMFWLSVYHCLYNQEKQSKELIDACNKLPPTLFDMPFVQLIRWFACPKGHATTGPLNHLFSLSNKDPTDIHLRHSVANLVACALGTRTCEKRSHLWYLVFAPEALRGTYLAGYMIDGPVSVEEGRPYQEGAQITNDDLSHLLQQSTRSDLSLNSRCMLLWINVASFCVSLLTRDRERLSGILASTEPMEKHCVSQLRHIWKFMRNNMQLTDEELSFLVMMCMRAYLQCWKPSQENMSGLFTDQAKVAKYEQQWHSIIFLPCLKKLRAEFFRHLPTPIRKLLVDIRQIQTCYPHFPDSTTALYSLLSLADVQMESQEKLRPLSQFICKMPEVQTTLPYLPDFLEFYQWLHRDLAGVLTPEAAHKISIKSLVKQMSKHYAGERGDKLMSLYQRVKDGYSHYLRAAGCITSAGGFEGIRVRNFLTLDANTSTANSNDDILYKLIHEMVTCHNSLLDCSQVTASHSEKTHLSRYLSPDTLTITPVDVTENTCILGKSDGANLDTEFLQLVCRRHQVSTKTHFADVMNPHLLTVQDLLKLQEDVASLYLGGRPKIANISSVHIPFTFKVSKHTYEAHPLNFGQDLNQVGKLLPPTLKHDFTDDHTVLQLLECEFHSVDYHTMLDVVTGLKTAIALLEKRVQETCSDGTDLHGLTLRSFLCNEEGKEQELEIFGRRLSGHQLSTLMNLKVSCLYHTFTTFTQWAIEGRYDFHRLPYALKVHLNQEDVEQLRKMPSICKKGSESVDLLREFKLLGEVLDHLESNLMVVGTQVPLVDYLTPMDIFEGHDEFLGLIPRTILIQHYMSLRILLKHLTAEVQKDLPSDKEEEDRRWLELVSSFSGELYEAQLETIQADYGFKHGYDSDTESIKVETCSSVTQFDLLHEDDLDEFPSLHTSDLKSLTGATSLSVKESTVTQKSVGASPKFPVATSAEEKTGSHHQTGMVMLESTLSAPVLDEKQLLQLARQYSSEAVANFVISIGYPDYAEQFEENGLSGDALMECTDEDLEDLGIKSALARLKIIILFRRQLQGLGSLAKDFPADKVIEFLDGLKQQEKEQYKKSFSDNQIDGEMLLAMQRKDDVMIELGVQRPIHRRIILSKFKTLIEEQGHSTT